MTEYYKHSGTVPLVGEVCGPHENNTQSVYVLALVPYDGTTYVVWCETTQYSRPDITRLDWFNKINKYREVQP